MKLSGVEQGPLAGMENAAPNQTPSQGKIRQGDSSKAVTEAVKSKPQYSPEQLKQSVETLNNTMKTYNTELRFELHAKSGEYMIKVLKDDGTVIREIPPKRVLDMVAYFKEKLGIIVDKLI